MISIYRGPARRESEFAGESSERMLHYSFSTLKTRTSRREQFGPLNECRRLVHYGGRLPPPRARFSLRMNHVAGGAVFTLMKGPDALVACGLAWDRTGEQIVWNSLKQLTVLLGAAPPFGRDSQRTPRSAGAPAVDRVRGAPRQHPVSRGGSGLGGGVPAIDGVARLGGENGGRTLPRPTATARPAGTPRLSRKSNGALRTGRSPLHLGAPLARDLAHLRRRLEAGFDEPGGEPGKGAHQVERHEVSAHRTRDRSRSPGWESEWRGSHQPATGGVTNSSTIANAPASASAFASASSARCSSSLRPLMRYPPSRTTLCGSMPK